MSKAAPRVKAENKLGYRFYALYDKMGRDDILARRCAGPLQRNRRRSCPRQSAPNQQFNLLAREAAVTQSAAEAPRKQTLCGRSAPTAPL
jgi:hypothetical protein